MIRGNQLVTFQTKLETTDAGGSTTISGENIAALTNVLVLIDPISASDQIRMSKSGHFANFKLYIDYYSEISEDLFVVWNSVTYKITGVDNPNNLNDHLELDIYRYV